METILNLGLNDQTVEAMIKLTNNPRFCYDSYRRFLTMFGSVAWEIDRQKFEDYLDKIKDEKGYKSDTELSAEDWKSLIEPYKALIKKKQEKNFHKTHISNWKKQLRRYSVLGIFLVRLHIENTTKLTTTMVQP